MKSSKPLRVPVELMKHAAALVPRESKTFWTRGARGNRLATRARARAKPGTAKAVCFRGIRTGRVNPRTPASAARAAVGLGWVGGERLIPASFV